MERLKGACTDWTSYVEINRPNCLILGRFAEKQGANRFGRLILTIRELSWLESSGERDRSAASSENAFPWDYNDAQRMGLTSGTKLGPYEIQSPLGSGGMGEVYRARDTRLGRDVALKILPESFAREGDRLHRFEQEALAVAALNHPNILAIFDTGQNDGSPFLVSELLEGETMRSVLDRGAVQ